MERNEIVTLRDLAKQVAEISKKDIQQKRRELWRCHNSFIKTRPPVLVSTGRYDCLATEIITEDNLKCSDPLYRHYEFELRKVIFRDSLEDDKIVEPWIAVRASFLSRGWGLSIKHLNSQTKGGAYQIEPVIKNIKDIEKLVKPRHIIDEMKTSQDFFKIQDVIGDIIKVRVDRSPLFQSFLGDISYSLVQLIGLEQLMFSMYDQPEWLHRILEIMKSGILAIHEEAETAGDWNLFSQNNQAEPYAEELPSPLSETGVKGRSEIWGYFASQEYTLISPEMFNEFLLRYQIPIMEKFGLIAYGCCEDLTNKICYLKKIPNLRRIAVAPWADVRKCAEQIQKDYIMSWRPNPSLMVCNEWDPDIIRKVVIEAMDATKDCYMDITLKDIQTVKNDPTRLKNWVKIVRDISEASM